CGKCYLPFTPAPSAQGFAGVVMPGAAPPAPAAVPVAPTPAAEAPTLPPQYAAAPPPPPEVATAMPLAGGGWAPPDGAPAMLGAPGPAPAWGTAPLQRVGWEPPAGPAAWPYGQTGAPAPDAVAEGRLFGGRAIAMVAISIGLGIVMQVIAYQFSRDTHRNIDS